MRFMALACDYDGTLASNSRVAATTLAALERARAAGVHLLLVTGRAFFELTRVCDRLDLFDAVVAENGGVLYFPGEGRISDLAIEPPDRLLAELGRRGIPYHAGRVVIGTLRDHEADVRAALAVTGMSLALVPNRDSLMLLPQGVHKGSGVRHVIRMLGLSARDVLALGDAENDADLFDACGFSGCPGNAVEVMKTRVDWVFAGENGTAIAGALARVADGDLTLPATSRHRVRLGWVAATADPVTLPGRDANLLVQGDPQSGKSWLAGALVERLALERYATCVIDPEGDYHVLAALPGVTAFCVARAADWNEVLAALRHDPATTVVADISKAEHADKVKLIEAGLRQIRMLRAQRGFPHWVVLDEAHYSLHREGVAADAFHPREKGFCFVTHRASWLRPEVIESIDTFILASTTRPEELAFLRAHLSPAAVTAAPALPRREFLLSRGGEAVTFVVPPRITSHIRHLGKYADLPVPSEHAFAFRSGDGQPVARAATLGEFAEAIGRVDSAVLEHHAAQGDFSRWVMDIVDDRHLAGHLRKVERRWTRGEIADLRQALLQPVGLAGEATRMPKGGDSVSWG